MKKNLQNKLKAYSAVAGSVAAVSAGAQVIYTDVNPDFIVHDTLSEYSLDLNNDTVTDFVLVSEHIMSSSYNGGIAIALNQDTANGILGSVFSTPYGGIPFPYALNNSDSIKPNSPFWNDTLNGGANYMGYYVRTSNNSVYTYCNWIGATDKYLGLRIKVNGEYHYGWARLTVTPMSDTIIVKDYAYEALPNVGLTAGQTVGIPTHENPQGVHVHAYQHTVYVNIAKPQDGGTISIYDLQGNLVREEEITNGNTQIDLGDKPAGVYLVRVRQGEKEMAQKVIMK